MAWTGLYNTWGNIGIWAIPTTKLEVAGQVKITGGSPGLWKILTSDATGLATWTGVVTATGINITWSTLGSTLYYNGTKWMAWTGLYNTWGNIGIGTTTPGAKLTLDSGTTGSGGLRFSRISSTSTPYAWAALWLGIDVAWNIVPISNWDVVVYTAQWWHPKTTVPDPDLPNRLISYDFNTYFAIPTKQSFVVSDGNGPWYNAPYFKENGTSGICSGWGSPYDCAVNDPVVWTSASPNNSFTMTAKWSVYGYQLALGARWDAPLFARSGKFVWAQTGWLYLSDNVTPTPWQKVLTVPANHLEYFYVNIGYNSQLQTIAGWGNVGIGTSFPDRRLVIASSGTTTADDPMVQIRRWFQWADAALWNVYGIPYLNIWWLENRVGSIQTIGFWYNSQSGTVRTAPAEIGFITTSVAGNTQGDIVFANRNGTANAAPTEVMRIKSTWNVGIGTANPQKRLEIDSGINDTSGLRFTRLNNTSPLTSSGIVTIGVNASWDVVGISPVSNIAVYEWVNRSMALSPDPDTANLLIKYNYNNYFAIPGKQSFVVSNGATVSDNGPFIKENWVVGVCSWNGLSGTSPYNCTDTVDGLSASPQNSFTMSAKSDNVGYQISLGARGDAPLMARSGYFTDSLHQTGWLYLADRTTISPWQKVISLPVNHPEYLFVNNGFNSQLQVISGWGNVAVGTTYPASRFEVWTGASTAPLLHFRGTRNVALGLDALDTSATGSITSSNNTAIGYNAGQNLTTGSNNILLGADTLAQANNSTNTLNIGNTIFGTNLPSSFGWVSGDIGLGVVSPSQQLDISRSMNLSSTRNSTTGVIYKNGTRFLHNFAKYAPNDNNVFIGLNAGNFTMGTGNLAHPVFYGTENVGIGANALIANTTWYSNTAIGHTTLWSNTTWYNNMAVGWWALWINTTGYGNSGIGRLTLGSNTTGFYNSALWMSALQSNIVWYYNSAVWYSALSANTTGFHNTANWYQSLLNNTTGQYNTAIGNLSLRTNSVGVQNTAVWYAALNSTTASYNTAIGLLAGSNITSANYNIAIGYNAQVASPTYWNQLSIGNWIYGSGWSIGIWTSSPTAKLDINGTIRIAWWNPWVGKILMSDATGIASWQTPSGGAVIPWTVAWNSGTSVASNFVGTTDLVDLAFRTNNVENMRLTSWGNLGIWTTNPWAYKLNINGTTYHANNIDIAGNRFINFLNPWTGLSSGLQWNLGTDTASMYVSEVVADQTDYVFKLSDNATWDRFVWQIHDWSPFDVFPMTLAGNYGNFYSGAMYIDNSSYGSAWRVGFGTTSPNAAAKVDINGLISIRWWSPGNGKVLVSDATGLASWQALSWSSGALGNWSIVGNTGTVATTNFIGTIDAIDLLFKTTNIERLRLNASNGNLTIGWDMMLGRGAWYVFGNTTFGAQALNSNGAGYQNTAIWYRTLAVNTTWYSNTAIGYAAGSGVSTGISNTFVWYRAWANITTGSSNIAIGNDAQVSYILKSIVYRKLDLWFWMIYWYLNE